MDVHPPKNGIFIGIDPYPNIKPWPMANLETHRGRSDLCVQLWTQIPPLEAPLSLNNFYGPSEAGIGATIYEAGE
jgi:hypothetical protein